jgi:hypothetical protein
MFDLAIQTVVILGAHFNIPEQALSAKLPISPLAGEMPGRAEGGAVPPTCQPVFAKPSGFSGWGG